MWQWVQISFDAIFLCFLLVARVAIRGDLRRSRPHAPLGLVDGAGAV